MIVNMTGSPYLEWDESAFISASQIGGEIVDMPYPKLIDRINSSSLSLAEISLNTKAVLPEAATAVIVGTNSGVVQLLIQALILMRIDVYIGPIHVRTYGTDIFERMN